MTNEEIERGIAAYQPMTDALLAHMSGRWVDQHEFDREFGWNSLGRPSNVIHYTPETFFLGTLAGGPRDCYLELTQMLIRLGRLEAKEQDGKVWYRAPKAVEVSTAGE